MPQSLLSIKGLSKQYPDGTQALTDFDLEVRKGELVAVIGLSGAGKSTLLRCINRLVEPTRGVIVVNGQIVTSARGSDLRRARRDIGMIFQEFNLIERLTVIRNVLHGQLGSTGTLRGALGIFPTEKIERALEVLRQVGLQDQAFKRCSELSGGQKQRVGIARAIMQDAPLILADEPIASLDVSSSEIVMGMLKKVVVAEGRTTIVNLHQVEFAREFADRVVGLRDGRKYCDIPCVDLDDRMIRELYYGHVPIAEHQAESGLP